MFPSLNVINGKSDQYGSKGVLRYYHYRSDLKLGLGIIVIRRITCSFRACTTILYLPWYYTIK